MSQIVKLLKQYIDIYIKTSVISFLQLEEKHYAL